MINLKTGVIGIGSMGKNHVRILSEVSNLVGVSDLDEEQGRVIANKYGISFFPDHQDLLDKIDSVSICVPTSLHRTFAESAINKKVHCLIEKPLCNNSSDAKLIVDLAAKRKVTVAVGHVERHNPIVTYAKEALKEGRWGEVITISSRRVSNYPQRIHDVGVLFDLCIHDIDISCYLSDSMPINVIAMGGKKLANYEDHVILSMTHESGIVSYCETNWLTPMKIRKLGLTTSKFYVELDYTEQTITEYKSNFSTVSPNNLYSSSLQSSSNKISIPRKEPLLLEILDFLNSVKNGTTPLVSVNEGYNVVKISEAALKSLQNKELVKL